jgi:hypothetical protein
MNNTKNLSILLLLSILCTDLQAKDQYFVLDRGVMPFTLSVNEPYRWLLPDGTPVGKPNQLTDNEGRAFVTKEGDQNDYLLDLMQGRFSVHVDPKCWEGELENFRKCAKITEKIKGCSLFKCQNEASGSFVDNYRTKSNRRSAWVLADLGEKEADKIINKEIESIVKIDYSDMAKNLAHGFAKCPQVDLNPPSAEADRLYQEAVNLPRNSDEQETAFIESAKLGFWRAASNLVNTAIANEDFESAHLITAWLIKRNAPSAHSKLAMTIDAISSNENASGAPTVLMKKLALKSAQAGDPNSMLSVGKELQAQRDHAELGGKLVGCAIAKRPDLK